jgi:hypothetical protein
MVAVSKVPSKNPGSKFATSAAYINACFDPAMAPVLANSPDSKLLPSYNKYIRR